MLQVSLMILIGVIVMQDLVNEKIRTQQLTDEVERINREMEVQVVKSAGVEMAQSEK